MNFKQYEQDKSIIFTTYDKNKLSYSLIYSEFDKQFPQYKENRKVNFQTTLIDGKYGKVYSHQFKLLLIL
jgi:hypothetical protein